jgi:hypothetical protein
MNAASPRDVILEGCRPLKILEPRGSYRDDVLLSSVKGN